ncbi:DUF2849 domain-containing protein [Rhodoplanes serenus]|uniref:DUF2849 domain-containing protein n=1 Tax=Rhodoplanes serenus TaxID=200615 RepID=A0A327KC31_9BRAD|nr:DUF2849 domain-containing protein [Rhodoplanes serenus]MTW15665.1 DUF2849 domain-containing protein [Rhodoplanes serenus]RAI32848.1 hypothetical protein CH340_14100 [Rhodoplanes serenus]
MSKRSKTFAPVVATANDLATGTVVFRTPDGRWSADLATAEIATTPAEADALRLRADADVAADRVVDLALVPVVRDGAFVRPTALRELIRASGPTITLPTDAPRIGRAARPTP